MLQKSLCALDGEGEEESAYATRKCSFDRGCYTVIIASLLESSIY